MATSLSPGRRFFGDAGSLRSFRGNDSPKTPSLRASSLKVKRSPSLVAMPMPNILGLKRGMQGNNSILRTGMTNKDVNTTGLEPAADIQEIGATPAPSRPSKDGKDVENDARPQTSSKPLQKSRTIIRLISTKFRARSPPPAAVPTSPRSPKRVPAAPADLISKENREAALRERGLLPPLKPKDLSTLEQEQDQHIPVVPLTEGSPDAEKNMTAANLIKQEWEAKNRLKNLDVTQRERLNTFKFGGMSSSAPSIFEEKPQAIELDTVVEVDTPLPSPLKSPENHDEKPASPVHQVDSEAPSSSLLRGNTTSNTLEPDVETPGDELSATTQRPTTPTKMSSEPHLVPLPPSPHRPRSSTMDSDQLVVVPTRLFAASVPLPPSPGPTCALDFSLEDKPAQVERREDISNHPSHDATPSSPSSQPMSESGSDSLNTPSLDTASQTMSISTLSTSEMSPGAGRGKSNNLLKLKAHDHGIPIIIESPVEEAMVKVSITDTDVIHDEPESNEPETIKDDEDDTHPTSPGLRPGGSDLSPPQEATMNRRKSINPFKRSQTLEPSNSTSPLTRRLSMAASINNIRRSVVGTLSRPKPSLKIGTPGHKTFDASHLPPSPTIPSPFLDQSRSPTSPISPTRGFFSPRISVAETHLSPRQAVSPVMHNSGTILQETNNIEDEETRRMTELAFLG